MSKWTHSICGACWLERFGEKPATRLVGGEPDTCCYCGVATSAGIYYRDDPATVQCGGRGGTHEGEED